MSRIARSTLVVLGALASMSASPRAIAQAPMNQARVPVLVELFTSEGCSSCPPADALLRELLAKQPVPGALVIGLSEHVDYWNRLGWTDPFSDHAFSERQSAYAAFARSNDVYTPQMVVDGRASFVGSDKSRALEEIAAAAARTKTPLDLRWRENGDLDVRVAPGTVTPNTPVWISIAEDGLTVKVPRGENADRTLTHDGVTRRLARAGRIDKAGGFRQFVPVALAASWRPGTTRVIVFAQEPGGPILALATVKVSDRQPQ